MERGLHCESVIIALIVQVVSAFGLNAQGTDPRPMIVRISSQPTLVEERAETVRIEGSGFTKDSRLRISYKTLDQSGIVFDDQPLTFLDSAHIIFTTTFPWAEGKWTAEIHNHDLSSGQFPFFVGDGDKRSLDENRDFDKISTAPKSERSPCTAPPTYVVNDYPFASYAFDARNSLGFPARECTSFAAWRINRDHGTPAEPYWFTNTMSRKGKTASYGNAGTWDQAARTLGFTVDEVPRIGSIAQWNDEEIPNSGHVAYVEAVNSDGSVWVSDYNWLYPQVDGTFCYHKISAPRYIHFNDLANASFSISPTNEDSVITAGQTAMFGVRITSQNGYNAPVYLTVLNLPPGITSGTGWNPIEVQPNSGADVTSTLSIVTSDLTETGNFPLILQAQDNNAETGVRTQVSLTIQPAIRPMGSFTASVNTNIQTVSQGENAIFVMRVKSMNTFHATVTPDEVNLPTGYVASGTYWDPPTITPPVDGSASSTFKVATSSATVPGTYSVTLEAKALGYTTQAVHVTIVVAPSKNPPPSISSLSPVSLPVGAPMGTLTIYGSGFLHTSSVTFNDVAHATTFIGMNHVTILLSSSDLATAGSYPVVVTNPAPGGGSSSTVDFTVTPTRTSREFLYVAYDGLNAGDLAGFAISPSTGQLESTGQVLSTGEPITSLAADPEGQFLATGTTDSQCNVAIETLPVNSASGIISIASPQDVIGACGGPLYVAFDPLGNYLYATVKVNGPGLVGTFGVDRTTGALAELGVSSYGGGAGIAGASTGAYFATSDTDNSFLGGASVVTFTLTSSGGLSSPYGQGFLAGSSPAGVAFDPTGTFVYTVNSGSSSISGYSVSPLGALTPVLGSPFTPGAIPRSIAVSPSGNFVFVSEDSGDLRVFARDTGSGVLTLATTVELPASINSSLPMGHVGQSYLAQDSTGAFLYVVTTGSPQIFAYGINQSTGALTQISGSPYSTSGELEATALGIVKVN